MKLLIFIQREYSSPVFISRVVMSALVSEWINSREGFCWRTDFINFLLLLSLFVMFFTRKRGILCPHGYPVSDMTCLF